MKSVLSIFMFCLREQNKIKTNRLVHFTDNRTVFKKGLKADKLKINWIGGVYSMRDNIYHKNKWKSG